MRNKGRTRKFGSRGDIIAWLRFSESGMIPKHIFNMRAKTTEKEKGIVMMRRIMSYFDLSMTDYEKEVEKIIIAEAYEQRNIQSPEEKVDAPEEKKAQRIVWKRDKYGNII